MRTAHHPVMRLPRGLRVRLKRLAYGGIGGGRDGERVVTWLRIDGGMRVADIGAGFGEFAVRLAAAVGPRGVVYAVDTDPDLREEVARTAERQGYRNLVPVAGTDADPNLPELVDLVFLSSSFHHLPDRVSYFERVRAELRPGGRVAILEGRPGPLTGWFGHSTRPEEVVATLERAGFRRIEQSDLVRWASLQTFEPTAGGQGAG
jgi:SAM-dependent methyltransferase